MTLIMPPKPGEDVNILAPNMPRLRGQVTRRGPGSLTIELEPGPVGLPRLAAGSEVAIEWVHPLGVMRVSATTEDARAEPLPTLRLGTIGVPVLVERREQARTLAVLDVSAWASAQPARRLAGKTVDLSRSGALLSVPDLSPFATTVELTIALPGRPLHVSARVVWRRGPALLGVAFERMGAEQEARLLEFLRSAPDHAPPGGGSTWWTK